MVRDCWARGVGVARHVDEMEGKVKVDGVSRAFWSAEE